MRSVVTVGVLGFAIACCACTPEAFMKPTPTASRPTATNEQQLEAFEADLRKADFRSVATGINTTEPTLLRATVNLPGCRRKVVFIRTVNETQKMGAVLRYAFERTEPSTTKPLKKSLGFNPDFGRTLQVLKRFRVC